MHGQITNGVRILIPATAELGQNGAKIMVAQLIEDCAQKRAVLEPCVHSLAEKRNHGVGSIAQQQRIVV